MLLSPIVFGLKLLDAHPMAPAPYCWGCWCRAANTVNHSTCMDDAYFPSSVRMLIPTLFFQRFSIENSLFCLFYFVSHHQSCHSHYSTNHGQWIPTGCRPTLTGRRPCRRKYHPTLTGCHSYRRKYHYRRRPCSFPIC